jgi:LacI family transcriptional regulator
VRIQKLAQKMGYTQNSTVSMLMAQILTNRGIRGLLLWPLLRPLGHLNLSWEHFAAVTVGYALTKPRLSYVAVDHYQIIAGALHQLHKLGPERIGLVIDRGFDGYQGGRVLSCYARYQQRQPLEPLKVDHVAPAAVSDAGLRQWFKMYQPDVLMILSQKYLDRFAQIPKIIQAKVPLCSLDITTEKNPAMGMHTRPEMVGAAAVDLVIEQLHSNVYGLPKIPKAVLIEGEWRRGGIAD